MIKWDYSKLEGIAIGFKKEIRRRIERDDTFSTSRDRLSKNDILERVEEAAKVAGFPTTLYYDPQENFDLCFALNQYENACVCARTDEEGVKEIGLPRAIGHVEYEEKYTEPVESAQEIYLSQIQEMVPLSYGMYTLLRIRYRVEALFGQPTDFLYDEITREKRINPTEMKKWRGVIRSSI